MVNKGLMKTSVILGIFLFTALHYYYPHDPTVLTGKASLEIAPSNFNMDSVMAFSFSMLVEYTVIVFAIYIFFRSVVKTFEKRMGKQRY